MTRLKLKPKTESKKQMDLEAAFERKYVSTVDLPEGEERVVTIKSVAIRELDQKDGSTVRKPVVELVAPLNPGGPTSWPLNKTNTRALKALFGSGEAKAWAGRSATLFGTTVQVGADLKPAIRVRKQPPGNGAPAANDSDAVLEDGDDLPF